MMSNDLSKSVPASAFDTLRDHNGRWVPDLAATAGASRPEPTTALAKAQGPSKRPIAPDIASATTLNDTDLSQPEPAIEARADYGFDELETADDLVDPGTGDAFFQTEIPRSKKERDLFASDAEHDAEKETEAPKSDTRRNLVEWVVVVVAAVILALVLRAFLVQAFSIPSESMDPTLEVGDRVLVNKLSYDFGEIERGDVVVFHRADAEQARSAGLTGEVIKRVIGIPGDTIEYRDNVLYLNDSPVEESYIKPGASNPDFGPVTVGNGYFFAMGDNRANSDDSRGSLGQIDQDLVVGRAFVIYWPLGRITRL